MTTPKLALPEITESQRGKYLTHNEALRLIEVLLTSVKSRTTAAEPGSPAANDAYILPASGITGTNWTNFNPHDIVVYLNNAWVRITPSEGAIVWVDDTDNRAEYDGTAWGTAAGGLGDPPANSDSHVLGVDNSAWTSKTLHDWAEDGRTAAVAPVSATHWRLLIHEVHGGPAVQVGDIEFRETAGVAETGPSGTAFASSKYTPAGPTNYLASAAFDGALSADGSSQWASNDPASFPEHIGTVFAAARDIAEVRVRHNTNHSWDMKRADLQYSTDGGTQWHTRASFDNLAQTPDYLLTVPAISPGAAVAALGLAGGEGYDANTPVAAGTATTWTSFSLPTDVSQEAGLVTGYATLRGTAASSKTLEIANANDGKGVQRLSIEDATGAVPFAVPLPPSQRELFYRISGAMTDVDIVVSGCVG